ncbi:MAG: hypothetical protein ABI131_03420 [Nostocoides sp.]
MRRRTLDALLTTGGAIVAVVLLIACGLLAWAGSFANGAVHDQLSQQKITMPAGPAIADPLIKPYLAQYAGQPMTTGVQAKAYADHFILVHMNKAGNGQTYEEVSGQYTTLAKDPAADPTKVKALGDLRQTLFMGNALRGMLLNAYAFGTFGAIAIWGAIASGLGSLGMFVLAGLGRRHLLRTPDMQDVRLGHETLKPSLV